MILFLQELRNVRDNNHERSIMHVRREWMGEHGPVTVVHLAAEYGSADVTVMTGVRTILLQWAADAEPPLLLLDLADTIRFGAAFMNVLLRCSKRIKDRGGRFALCNVNSTLIAVLDVAHLSSLWPICSTRDEAMQAFRPERPA